MIKNIQEWQKELIFTGNIVQDTNESVPQPEAERRFNRYIELLDMVEGDEGQQVLTSVIRSIQVKHDYGAYQTTLGIILWKFPPDLMIPVLLSELPTLIHRQPDWAGDIINQIAQQHDTENKVLTELFNKEIAKLSNDSREIIVQFVRNEENGGWLGHLRGILCLSEA
jgi:hypothetical protein